MKIILGSQSLSRRQILVKIVPRFEVLSPDINEMAIRSEDYARLPLLLAHAKADALLPKITGKVILITSDQVVVCNGELREKPDTPDQARRFLASYAHYPAQTNTAVVVHNTATGKRFEGIDIARAYFSTIPEDVIERLIDDGNVFLTSGGFIVEDPLLSRYLIRIEGEKESVMGMPIILTRSLLADAMQG